jgi:hypothetical protein
MPSEAEMLPRDKYTVFDRKQRGYRKGIHSMWHFMWNIEGVHMLTCCCRGTEVDQDQSESQSAWLLISSGPCSQAFRGVRRRAYVQLKIAVGSQDIPRIIRDVKYEAVVNFPSSRFSNTAMHHYSQFIGASSQVLVFRIISLPQLCHQISKSQPLPTHVSIKTHVDLALNHRKAADIHMKPRPLI